MSKLYFSYAAMNAGKSTTLLQSSFNYQERGMETMLWTAALDTRYDRGVITSRIGLNAEANLFDPETDLRAEGFKAFAAATDAIRALGEVAPALQEFGDRRVVTQLIPLLDDPNSRVRSIVSQVLTNLTRQSFGPDAAKWQAWWEAQQE